MGISGYGICLSRCSPSARTPISPAMTADSPLFQRKGGTAHCISMQTKWSQSRPKLVLKWWDYGSEPTHVKTERFVWAGTLGRSRTVTILDAITHTWRFHYLVLSSKGQSPCGSIGKLHLRPLKLTCCQLAEIKVCADSEVDTLYYLMDWSALVMR